MNTKNSNPDEVRARIDNLFESLSSNKISIEAAIQEMNYYKIHCNDQYNIISKATGIPLSEVYVRYNSLIHSPAKKNAGTRFGIGCFGTGLKISCVLIVGFLLSFHILPDHGMILPKDSLSFSKTFITQEDVDSLIDRYNNASTVFEQQIIAQDPIYRKLREEGIIVKKNKDY